MEYYDANIKYGQTFYRNGVINLDPNLHHANDTSLFSIWCGFNNASTSINYHTEYCSSRLPRGVIYPNTSTLLNGSLMPSIWNSVNILGKATYFSLLADLGHNNLNDNDIAGGPNMLAVPSLLADLSQNLTVVNETLRVPFRQWLPSELEQVAFTVSDAGNWSLGISPAVLTTNYICQVPRLKTRWALFISVLVADLVMLKSLWTIFKLGVDTICIGKHPELKSCRSCASEAKELDNISEGDPLVPGY